MITPERQNMNNAPKTMREVTFFSSTSSKSHPKIALICFV